MIDDLLLRSALAGFGVSLIAAPLGCFIIWQRMSYYGSTIAHSGLLGVALGFLLAINTNIAILTVGLLLSFFLVLLQRQKLLPIDSLLGILAHAFLAAGLIAATLLQDQRLDLISYLFGDILAISSQDIILIYALSTLSLILLIWRWDALLMLSIHEELAQAEGIQTAQTRFLFMFLISMTVALAMKIVGILLITAMMIIPAATARPFANSPEQMAILAVFISAFAMIGGLVASFYFDSPAGPTIVMVMTSGFLLSLFKYKQAA